MDTRQSWTSNYNNNETNYFTKDETISSVQTNFDYRRKYSSEGANVIIDGCNEDVLIQDHTNPLYRNRPDKKLHTANDSNIKFGSYVVMSDTSTWLTVSKPNSVDGAYLSSEIVECNYLLKFQNKDTGEISSYPIIFTSSSSSLDYKQLIVTVDHKIQIRVTFNSDTSRHLITGTRLMIENRDVESPNVYIVVGVDSVGNSYTGNSGILIITLEKDSYNPSTDNKELGICDYFTTGGSTSPEDDTTEIIFDGDPEVKQGGSFKVFEVVFPEENILPTWTVNTDSDIKKYIIYETYDNKIKIRVSDESDIVLGRTFTLNVKDELDKYSASLDILIISLF